MRLLLKILLLKHHYLWPDHSEWRTNACEVNLTPHTVYLIAAVPEMRDEEERLTAPNKSDLVVSDPNMRQGPNTQLSPVNVSILSGRCSEMRLSD